MIIYLLFPIVEHLVERQKELLASWCDSRGWKAYYAYWGAPVLAWVNSALLVAIVTWGSLRPSEIVLQALIPTAMSMVYYEVSNLWKQKKREAMPLHTKAIAKTIEIDRA